MDEPASHSGTPIIYRTLVTQFLATHTTGSQPSVYRPAEKRGKTRRRHGGGAESDVQQSERPHDRPCGRGNADERGSRGMRLGGERMKSGARMRSRARIRTNRRAKAKRRSRVKRLSRRKR